MASDIVGATEVEAITRPPDVRRVFVGESVVPAWKMVVLAGGVEMAMDSPLL